jgi:hypothetical protein
MNNHSGRFHVFVQNVLVTCSNEFSKIANSPLPLAEIVSRGARYPELLSLQEYLPMKEKGRSQFDCSRCGTGVISGTFKNHWLQACRCSFLISFKPKNRLCSAAQWTNWQLAYDEESADSIPFHDARINPLSGALPELAQDVHDWLSRRKGLPDGIRYNWDGTITVGKSTISLGEQGTVTTFDEDDREGIAKSAEVLKQIARQSEPPRYVVCSGIDPDYVWPPGTDYSSIKTAPFRCSSCNAWVKNATIEGLPYYDRVLVCLCHSFIVRKDIQAPGNYRQWRELLLIIKSARFEHDAKLQKGLS